MLPRKSKWADLERHRTLFFMLGLAISMFLIYLVINIKFYDEVGEEPVDMPVKVVREDEIPITYRPEPAGAPPPPTSNRACAQQQPARRGKAQLRAHRHSRVSFITTVT